MEARSAYRASMYLGQLRLEGRPGSPRPGHRPGRHRLPLIGLVAVGAIAFALASLLGRPQSAPAGLGTTAAAQRPLAAVFDAAALVAAPAPAASPAPERPAARRGAEQAGHAPGPAPGPSADALRRRVDRATPIAAAAAGPVSFAVIGADGRVHGYREHLTYPSASVVKSMLLAAELRLLHRTGAPLDAGTRDVLRAMITISDNDAATAIYDRVGDEGLRAVADRAGMTDFSVSYAWGNARISAADMALLFADLDDAFPREHDRFAKGLLGSITPDQSWGIPVVAPKGWSVRFKGGWRPTELGQLTHQVAELRSGDRKLAIAVLTDGEPSMGDGIGLIERIGRELSGG